MEGAVCRVKSKPQDTAPGVGTSEIWTFSEPRVKRPP